MQQHRTDMLLLEQAYQATQLKQHLSDMSVRQVQLVIENASAAELEVIEEFIGGLKNIGKAVGGAAKKAGKNGSEAMLLFNKKLSVSLSIFLTPQSIPTFYHNQAA